jgi:transcriptional regulator with XRE-family HTH domain
MIKNQKQASVTKDKLKELIQAKEDFQKEQSSLDSIKFKLGLSSFEKLIAELSEEIQKYDSLTQGNFHVIKPKDLRDLPNALIAARLAQKLSQKDLATLLDIQEQQIQRYESSDYEAASWSRIVEIAYALKMKFHFEQVLIINQDEPVFNLPSGITEKQALDATIRTRKNHSLIIQ